MSSQEEDKVIYPTYVCARCRITRWRVPDLAFYHNPGWGDVGRICEPCTKTLNLLDEATTPTKESKPMTTETRSDTQTLQDQVDLLSQGLDVSQGILDREQMRSLARARLIDKLKARVDGLASQVISLKARLDEADMTTLGLRVEVDNERDESHVQRMTVRALLRSHERLMDKGRGSTVDAVLDLIMESDAMERFMASSPAIGPWKTIAEEYGDWLSEPGNAPPQPTPWAWMMTVQETPCGDPGCAGKH